MIGTTVSHFLITDELGRGGMGVVYRAEDTRLERAVALKFLPSAAGSDTRAKERFMAEAKAASALDHANICTIYDVGESDDGRLFIAMGFYKGQTLRERIREGTIAPAEAIAIVRQIGAGLSRAHEAGIVHRDVKPANIMVTQRGEVKILDFGVAKLSEASGLTTTGSTIGTTAYMSPEQARGEDVDHRTDIWATGVILYEMLAGRRPFSAEYEAAVTYKIINEAPDPLPVEMIDHLPPHIERVLERALAKDPRERYANMGEMLEDLEPVAAADERSGHTAGHPEGRADPTGDSPRSWYSRPWIWLGALVLVAVAALVTFLTPGAESGRVYDSIAVLPFENISLDPETQPFASGIHDGLLTELTRLTDLDVISRTSVMAYANERPSLLRIAEDLDVSTVLEGTVQSGGQRVRVNVQLIDAREDRHIWAENYDRELTTDNIFEIQTDLSRQIAEQLHAQLTPLDQVAVSRSPTQNLTAYGLYSQGRANLDQRTESGMRRALEFFDRAIREDSTFALAWVGLSDAYYLLHSYGHEPAEVALSGTESSDRRARPIEPAGAVLPQAESSVRRALQIEPGLAEAHASLGMLHELKREGPAAIRELERARDLLPGYAEAHNWLTWVGLMVGRPQAALRSGERAVELNPLSVEALTNLGSAYLITGDTDKAQIVARRALDLDPEWPTARMLMGQIMLEMRRLDDAREYLDGVSVPWTGAGAESMLAVVHVLRGDTLSARQILEQVESSGDAFSAGIIYGAMDENDAAFASFDRVDDWGAYWPTLTVRYYYPRVLADLRADARFEGITREVNLAWGLAADGGGLER